MTKYRKHKANLDNYPKPQSGMNKSGAQLYVGDLHGNTLKLFYYLVRWGIAEVTAADYSEFVTIYKSFNINRRESIEAFHAFLGEIKIHNKGAVIHFIGDEVADRGENDYLTLKIFEKLHVAGQEFEILLSNHGLSLVQAHEAVMNGSCYYSPVILDFIRHAHSQYQLNRYIQDETIELETIKTLIENHYLPCLKLITYTVSEDRKHISISSHASIDLKVIESVCNKLGINYDDSSVIALTKTIDSINDSIKIYLTEHRFSELLDMGALYGHYGNRDVPSPAEYPIEFCLWNRDYSILERSKQSGHPKTYAISWFHGHDSSESFRPWHVNCLDDLSGKSPHHHNVVSSEAYSTHLSATLWRACSSNPLWHMHNHFLSLHLFSGHRDAFLVDFSNLYQAMLNALNEGRDFRDSIDVVEAPKTSKGDPIEFKGDYGTFRKTLCEASHEDLTGYFQQYDEWINQYRELPYKKHTHGEVIAAIIAEDCAKTIGYTGTRIYHV